MKQVVNVCAAIVLCVAGHSVITLASEGGSRLESLAPRVESVDMTQEEFRQVQYQGNMRAAVGVPQDGVDYMNSQPVEGPVVASLSGEGQGVDLTVDQHQNSKSVSFVDAIVPERDHEMIMQRLQAIDSPEVQQQINNYVKQQARQLDLNMDQEKKLKSMVQRQLHSLKEKIKAGDLQHFHDVMTDLMMNVTHEDIIRELDLTKEQQKKLVDRVRAYAQIRAKEEISYFEDFCGSSGATVMIGCDDPFCLAVMCASEPCSCMIAIAVVGVVILAVSAASSAGSAHAS